MWLLPGGLIEFAFKGGVSRKKLLCTWWFGGLMGLG